MLQKGFLRSHEEKKNNRLSRIFTFAGILLIIGGILLFMFQIQQAREISIAWLILVIVGFLLVSISMWMNFFAQSKNRRR